MTLFVRFVIMLERVLSKPELFITRGYCNLLNAGFGNTNLEKADFRGSENYSIDQEINKLKGAKFSFPAVIGLLDRDDITIDFVD